jgi:predicted dehydrogenase/nucleoside-diphosphate-sugar epimerase
MAIQMTELLERNAPMTVARRVTSPAAPVRIAVVGCGAMSKHNLMPVLAGHTRVRLEALVDVDAERARALAQSYGVAQAMSDIDTLSPERIDAVILATPPACHMRQTIALARRGLHVFVEKPMALTVADADAMVAAADEAGVALSVGFYRRLLPSTRLLRALIDSEMLGRVVSIDVEEGGEYGWQLATLANLTRTLGGGGVLIDIGSHVIDQLQLILPGAVDVRRYSDNSKGGVETDAVLELTMHGGRGVVPCRIELSRTRQMRNSIRVRCERGTLELRRGEFARVAVQPDDLEARDPLTGLRVADLSAQWGDEPPLNGYQAFRAEMDDWLDAMTLGRDPVLSGRSVLPTVRVVEESYQRRQPLAEPWSDEGLHARRRRAPATKRRVLITGASGFIGCRTAEILSRRDGWDVRALVRDPSHAARLASLPVEMMPGDICAPDSLVRALDGCDAVVHCAVGTSWKRDEVTEATVNGTRNVAAAARQAGIARFVHISSMAVYATEGSRVFDESSPLIAAAANNYGSDKRRAEDAVRREIAAGLPGVILRPTRVYGPYGKTFIVRPLQHLSAGRLVLAGPVDAPANMVYVDNVVEAIAAALDADPSVVGQAFNVSDPDQVSWREFYDFYAQALDRQLRVSPLDGGGPAGANARRGGLSLIAAGVKEIVGSTEFRNFGRKCLETDPIGTLPRWAWERFPALRKQIQHVIRMEDAVVYRPEPVRAAPDLVFRVEDGLVPIDKAQRTFGYAPIVTRPRAMALTLDWMKFSRLLQRQP